MLLPMQEQVLKSRAMQRLEHRLGEPLEAYLSRRYHAEGATLYVLADDLSLSVGTLSRWFAILGIETRLTGPRRAAVA